MSFYRTGAILVSLAAHLAIACGGPNPEPAAAPSEEQMPTSRERVAIGEDELPFEATMNEDSITVGNGMKNQNILVLASRQNPETQRLATPGVVGVIPPKRQSAVPLVDGYHFTFITALPLFTCPFDTCIPCNDRLFSERILEIPEAVRIGSELRGLDVSQGLALGGDLPYPIPNPIPAPPTAACWLPFSADVEQADQPPGCVADACTSDEACCEGYECSQTTGFCTLKTTPYP